MASNVVNLNRFRKQKRREEEARQAEINRVRHGRTKGEKARELADRNLAGLIQTTQHGLEAALRDAVNGKPPADT